MFSIIFIILTSLFFQLTCQVNPKDCSFLERNAVCPLMVENVIDIEVESPRMNSMEGCQYQCFLDKSCHNFTYFANDVGKRCILFRDCHSTMPCMKCVSGPRMPPIMKCKLDNNEKSQDLQQKPGEPEITTFRPPTFPLLTKRPTLEKNQEDDNEKAKQPQRQPKQLDIEGEDNSFDVEFIDDGLFGEEEEPREVEPTTTTTRRTTTTTLTTTTTTTTLTSKTTEVPLLDEVDEEEDEIELMEDEDEFPTRTTPSSPVEAFPDEYFDEVEAAEEDESDEDEGILRTNTKTMTFYHCLFGGYGPVGPIAGVGHVGAAFMRRQAPIIRPLPRAFPLGSQGVHATIYKRTLFICSPGAALENPQFFSFFGQGQRAFQPGQCYYYDRENKAWKPFSSPMNSYRGGASISRMGRFIVVSGGNRFPAPLSSIEVLNTRKPEKWRTLSKLTLPNPTYDHCTVAVNKTSMFVTGGFGQESQAIMMDLLGKTYRAEEPMRQPRRKHSCVRARVNGREGVIVAGGASDGDPALNLVEFFDLKTQKWMSLGRTREGRRFPGLMVMGKHLLVAGGETTDPIGRTVILDSMETLVGKRWVPLRQRLPERRSRFSLIRIPRSYV